MIVAAASAAAAPSASTVTASAIPREKLRPRHPLVATPRTGSEACKVVVPNSDGRSGRSTIPTTNVSPALRCRAISPPSFTYARARLGSSKHRRKNLFRHRARYGRHRRDETLRCIGHHGRYHSPRHRALAAMRSSGATCLPQVMKARAQFVENGHESRTRRAVCRLDFTRRSECLHDQVDRPIVKMQSPSIGQQSDLRARLSSFSSASARLERPRIVCPRLSLAVASFVSSDRTQRPDVST